MNNSVEQGIRNKSTYENTNNIMNIFYKNQNLRSYFLIL